MPQPTIIREAEFDPAVKNYYMVSTTIVCVITVVGIVLLPVVWIVGRALIQSYLERMSCVLTERTLEMKRGILSRVESTVPLEKITDLQMFQGPLMRAMGLHGFKVETAGQTGVGMLMIIGIADAPAFRQAVLDQRDTLAGAGAQAARAPVADAPSVSGSDPSAIGEIRDTLNRIERLLEAQQREP